VTTPVDVWLVCGNPVESHRKGHGCTCSPTDPTAKRSQDAINRLARQHLEEAAKL
jgi:hypothetical protein